MLNIFAAFIVGSIAGSCFSPRALPPGGQSPAQAAPAQSGIVMAPPKAGLAIKRPEAGKEPRLVFDTEFHEFGEVDEGDELETPFPFHNEGRGDLIIINQYPHCGCSRIWIDVEGKLYVWGDPIPPKAKGIVHFVMRTAGFQNDKPSGVDLYTNDPARGTMNAGLPVPVNGGPEFGIASIRVHTFIKKVFEFDPGNTLALGSVINLEDTVKVVHLRNNKGKPFEITGLEPATDNDIKVSYAPEDATNSKWAITVSIPKGHANGSITKIVNIKSNPQIPPQAAVLYILGSITGAVETDPPGLLAFGPVTLGQATMRQIVVKNRHPSLPLKITNIRLLDPQDKLAQKGERGAKAAEEKVIQNLKLTVSEMTTGKDSRITVECAAGMPAGFFGARLAFDTGIEGGPYTVTLPISGYVR
ncbi:MAG: DUF1573 domain-containing protein [Planctomycetes bacterium]|nr:DUF1573 domain-containing protein [Planctomycetota bacterium]